MTCQICGEKSGFYPLCKVCFKLRDEGKVTKCQEWEKWKEGDKPFCYDCGLIVKKNKEKGSNAYKAPGTEKDEIIQKHKEGMYEKHRVKAPKGKEIKVVMNKHVNESPEHFTLQNLVFRLVKEDMETAQMFLAVKPDVVFHTTNGTKIAFELETGARLNVGVQKFVDKNVKVLKRDYSDYYFIVIGIDDRSKYEKFGKVLAGHEVEGKLRGLFNA